MSAKTKLILLTIIVIIFTMFVSGCMYEQKTEDTLKETICISNKESIVRAQPYNEDDGAEYNEDNDEQTESDDDSADDNLEIVENVEVNETEDDIGVDTPTEEYIEEDVDVDTTEEVPDIINLGEFTLTAYCSCEVCCGEYALNRPIDENGNEIVYGASGTRLVAGVSIAVDPYVIPYGSEVIINDHTYIAQDTGGAINGNRIDVYFDNHEEAWDFGLQYAEVFLIK